MPLRSVAFSAVHRMEPRLSRLTEKPNFERMFRTDLCEMMQCLRDTVDRPVGM